MAEGSNPSLTSSPRRWPRFGLRSLLVVFAAIAVIVSVVNTYLRPKIERRIAVGRIFDSGGRIWFQDLSQEIGVENPYTAIRPSLWRTVGSIEIRNDVQADVVAQEARRIPELGNVEFGGGVTDAGVVEICESRDCDAIEAVSFFECAVTSVGTSRLSRLPKLRRVMFNTCPINSAGIAELKHLTQLESLVFVEDLPNANYDRLDDACFDRIGELSGVRDLNLGGVNVSDTAATKLYGMDQLKTLIFYKGHISDAAVSRLRTTLPSTAIFVY